MKTKNLKDKMLSKDQTETVKFFIVDSMRNAYTNQGSIPGDGFNEASGLIADNIIKNVQMALIQNTVFAKAAKENKPTKKHVRK